MITQGHIDPEDFNGDPEMNKLGQRGIHAKKPKAKASEEDEEEEVCSPTVTIDYSISC